MQSGIYGRIKFTLEGDYTVSAPACDIPFIEKTQSFAHDLFKCCLYISSSTTDQNLFTKMLYSKLTATTKLLEDFLDSHGAKNNKNWYYFRELTATLIHLSIGGYSQKHISGRLIFYGLQNSGEFAAQGQATQAFLNASMMKIAPAILEEAQRLNIPIPEKGYEPSDFPTSTASEMLESDVDDTDTGQQKQHIVKIASEFLSIAGNFDQLGFYEPYDIMEIRAIVPKKVNEVEVRRFEMLVHNLQSSFDTYVIHGGFRIGKRKLTDLRGHFSVVFHLLQMTGRLLHLYERHLHEAGYKNTYKMVQDRLSSLVDPDKLLDRTINYGLYYACHFLNTGKKLAREILNENIERSSIKVGIPVALGFHSRPSLLVAKIVQYYGGQVELCIGQDRFDASSVLDIQWAGGKIHKENLTEVIFEGDTRALADIEILAGMNYGEDTMGKGVPLPKELKYLR
jgi:phosphotransferase system HPr-like phosphotransfer protein